jgi:hypothetical protein
VLSKTAKKPSIAGSEQAVDCRIDSIMAAKCSDWTVVGSLKPHCQLHRWLVQRAAGAYASERLVVIEIRV